MSIMKLSTLAEFQAILAECQQLFTKKHADYGSAWRIMRLPTITDQIFIKAKRIRTIQEVGKQEVEDNIANEFVGIINYCLIALIQSELESKGEPSLDLSLETIQNLYRQQVTLNEDLLKKKNHDYGEAWRDMRVSSMTDLILMKILRLKQIEDKGGKMLISEGAEANYRDILNYAVFCLIQMNDENKEQKNTAPKKDQTPKTVSA
jgi:hypothetical protein